MWWLTDRLHQDVAERSGDADNLCEFKNGDWAKAYHHLTHDERCQIGMMKESGEAAIARRLGRNPSSRELTRNASRRDPSSRAPSSREPTRDAGQRDYDFAQADRLAAERRSAASAQPRKMTSEWWGEVDEKLALQWSPEQISGRLRLEGRAVSPHQSESGGWIQVAGAVFGTTGEPGKQSAVGKQGFFVNETRT